MIQNIDVPTLERVLTGVFHEQVHIVHASELGASSRATPWRIDLDIGGRMELFVLRYGESVSRTEVAALNAMEHHAIPTPRVLYWDESGGTLGTPVFLSEFLGGKPLLAPMVAGEEWAVDLYIDTACDLQAIRLEDLPHILAEQISSTESARDVIDAAYQRFPERTRLHEAAYRRLVASQPVLPSVEFSNGDLWPENMLVKDRRLTGVIDWQHAGLSDPLFEFLLPFFLVPDLRNRGTEERYCQRKGFDPALLHWYHGVEFFDSLAWVLKTGKPYEIHTADSLEADLATWLAS